MVAAERADRDPRYELPIDTAFLDAIGRSELKEVVTEETPFLNISLEVGNNSMGLKTGGGLGILEGDMLEEAADKLEYVTCTLGYSQQWHQKLNEKFYQTENFQDVLPETYGFSKVTETSVLLNENRPTIEGYIKEKGKAKLVTLYNPKLGWLYQDSPSSEQRMRHLSILSFSGYNILKNQGYFPADKVEKELNPKKYPAVVRLNEAATSGFALAMVDDLCFNGASLQEAIEFVRNKVILTNHTLEQAAIPSYPKEFYEKYFFPNLRFQGTRELLEQLIQNEGGERLNIGSIGLLLASKVNAVSKDHARIASSQFKRPDGSKAEFAAVTNGIHKRWIDNNIMGLYKSHGIYGDFDLPAKDIEQRIDALDPSELHYNKQLAKQELIKYLKEEREDQYGRPVIIPEGKNIIGFARRFDGYKQNDILLDDLVELKNVLKEDNAHLIIAGTAHPDNEPMKRRLQDMLKKIDEDPELRTMVTFVQDYNEELGKQLIAGCDIWVNTPMPGREACGTSIFKAIANHTILVSIPDGGMLDNKDGVYIRVTGTTREDQRISLYKGVRKALELLPNPLDSGDEVKNKIVMWGRFTNEQHKSYAKIISGARMMNDYLNFGFPTKEEPKKEPRGALLQKAAESLL